MRGTNERWLSGFGCAFALVIAACTSAEAQAESVAGGTVWAWGRNYEGQLGNGTTADHDKPGHGILLVTARGRVLRAEEPLKLRGDDRVVAAIRFRNPSEQKTQRVPARVEGLSQVVAVDAHGRGSIALKADGTVWVWGSRDDARKGLNSLPVQVQGLPNVSKVFAGSAAIDAEGKLWAWGGIGGVDPVRVDGLSDVVDVSVGSVSYAVRKDGTLWCWAPRRSLEHKDGWTVQAKGLAEIKAVVPSSRHHSGWILKEDGTVWSWRTSGKSLSVSTAGLNRVEGLAGIASIAAGEGHAPAWGRDGAKGHALALRRDGTVWAWGKNEYGQLGDGTGKDREGPIRIEQGLTDVTAIAVGKEHSLALKKDGTVWAWGRNNEGQLGDGTAENRSAPVRVKGLVGAIAIAAGREHSLALTLK